MVILVDPLAVWESVLIVEPEESSGEADTLETTEDTMFRSTFN